MQNPYYAPAAPTMQSAPSGQRGGATGTGKSPHVPSLGGVFGLLFAAVAVAVVLHILGVRFFFEVRRG